MTGREAADSDPTALGRLPQIRFSMLSVDCLVLLVLVAKPLAAMDAPVIDVARFQQYLESTCTKGLEGAVARDAPSRSCRISSFLVGK